MLIEITVPRLGWTMEEGTFVAWLKKPGDRVRAGEPLFTLDGDKALQEVEAIDSGILRIPPDAPEPGSTVKVGRLLGYLVTDANESESVSDMAAVAPSASETLVGAEPPQRSKILDRVENLEPSARSNRRAISPRALRVAAELNVNWTVLKGSGRGGRIRERDVVAAASGSKKSTARAAIAGQVAITDWTFPDLGIEEEILKPLGHRIIARQCKSEADLISLAADADCVITQFARVNANVIAALSRARAIVRYGIGVDNVDLDAARAHGIPVCNVPDYCIDEVADHTLAFILAATRQVVSHTVHLRAGNWGLAGPLAAMKALRDLTVGVIGFGRIGREVVRRLIAFKCQVVVFDPVVPAVEIERAGARPAASVEKLLPICDILTLHCPSTAKTRRMIGRDALAALKPGAILINVARGDLVDTAALIEALQSGHLGGAALDVCDPEPIPADSALLKLSNVIVAPHIASASPPAVRRLRETAATLAATALKGELPPNVVNGVTVPRHIA